MYPDDTHPHTLDGAAVAAAAAAAAAAGTAAPSDGAVAAGPWAHMRRNLSAVAQPDLVPNIAHAADAAATPAAAAADAFALARVHFSLG